MQAAWRTRLRIRYYRFYNTPSAQPHLQQHILPRGTLSFTANGMNRPLNTAAAQTGRLRQGQQRQELIISASTKRQRKALLAATQHQRSPIKSHSTKQPPQYTDYSAQPAPPTQLHNPQLITFHIHRMESPRSLAARSPLKLARLRTLTLAAAQNKHGPGCVAWCRVTPHSDWTRNLGTSRKQTLGWACTSVSSIRHKAGQGAEKGWVRKKLDVGPRRTRTAQESHVVKHQMGGQIRRCCQSHPPALLKGLVNRCPDWAGGPPVAGQRQAPIKLATSQTHNASNY